MSTIRDYKEYEVLHFKPRGFAAFYKISNPGETCGRYHMARLGLTSSTLEKFGHVHRCSPLYTVSKLWTGRLRRPAFSRRVLYVHLSLYST